MSKDAMLSWGIRGLLGTLSKFECILCYFNGKF